MATIFLSTLNIIKNVAAKVCASTASIDITMFWKALHRHYTRIMFKWDITNNSTVSDTRGNTDENMDSILTTEYSTDWRHRDSLLLVHVWHIIYGARMEGGGVKPSIILIELSLNIS